MKNKKFVLIAGPCVIESQECLEEIAFELNRIAVELGIDYYFKSSFDKANRTSVDAYRGPGVEKGMEMLQRVKEKFGVKITTDIHEPWQAAVVAEVADLIQIPAFLCRQTDLLVAAGKTGKTINIKKGQFLAPDDVKYVVEKVKTTGNHQILLCERGSFFGYHNLVVDMTNIVAMKELGYPVIMDATHSVQKPGAGGGYTSGNREYAKCIALAGVAAGADGLFMEVHPDPDKALSDGANMIPLHEVETLVRKALRMHDLVNEV